MDGSLMGTRNHGWMDQPVSLALNFPLYDGLRYAFTPLAPMLDFWRNRKAWLPTWSTSSVEERSFVM